jgi:hypothetical protein
LSTFNINPLLHTAKERCDDFGINIGLFRVFCRDNAIMLHFIVVKSLEIVYNKLVNEL